MASNMVGERLPGVVERQRILEEAGLVLAEARWLRDCLDRTDGRLNPGNILPPKPATHYFILTQSASRLTSRAQATSALGSR